MTISAISSFSASQVTNFQQYRQAFSQLTNALQSGDMTAAQNAYNTLSSSPMAQGNGPFAQALQQIGKDLQANDLSDAQNTLAQLQQQQQAHRGHHHHHHHGGVSGSDPSNTAGTNANGTNSDDNSDGSTTVDITITVDSTNKIDIKA
jgi:hypothetical protein